MAIESIMFYKKLLASIMENNIYKLAPKFVSKLPTYAITKQNWN